MEIATGVKYCASCFGQYPNRKHVDMHAYYDGPTFEQENGDFVGIDDLVICEQCLKEAGELVGLFPVDSLKKENVELGEALERKQEEYNLLQESYSDLKKAFEKLSDQKIAKLTKKPRIVEKV